LGVKVNSKRLLGLPRDPGFGLFGDVRGVIVEDHFDRRVGRIGGVEQGEKFDEFAAAMPIPDQSVRLAGEEVECRPAD